MLFQQKTLTLRKKECFIRANHEQLERSLGELTQ